MNLPFTFSSKAYLQEEFESTPAKTLIPDFISPKDRPPMPQNKSIADNLWLEIFNLFCFFRTNNIPPS